MRAALSILGLVVVLAIVMVLVKQQSKALLPPKPVASQPGGATAPAPNLPESVRQQVDAAMQQGAARASDAQP
jgi:hypothetical protein